MAFRRILKRAAPLLVLALAGIVVIGIDRTDTTHQIVGGGLEALAGVGLMSLLFYEVGKSEDRAREADKRR